MDVEHSAIICFLRTMTDPDIYSIDVISCEWLAYQRVVVSSLAAH